MIEASAYAAEFASELNSWRYGPFDGTLQGPFALYPRCDPSTGELHAICYDARQPDSARHGVAGVDRKMHP